VARGSIRWSPAVALWMASTVALAQESYLHADFRGEEKRVSGSCDSFNFKALGGCAYELFTDHPLHVAVGSMPPQNGFALGGAFVESWNTPNWRLSWDADAVGSFTGTWRAGGYMTMMHTPPTAIHVIQPVMPQPGAKSPPRKKPQVDLTHPYTVFNLYAQAISLNKLNYFGLGNDTTLAGASVFGMRQTIVGGNVAKPIYELPSIRSLSLALRGEINGRFVDVQGEQGDSAPSIETLYTNATAPGLSSHPGFVQLGEGFSVDPVIGDHLEVNYLGNFQEFFAPSNSDDSFLRWSSDLNLTFYLYGYTESGSRKIQGTGPDECARTTEKCKPVSISRNLNGSIGARFFVSESITSATSEVPFYFEQTLGGSDINSDTELGSYQDYRFRAPNLLLLQEHFEHSIWGPFGMQLMADQGRVALTRGDLGFDHFRHSFAAGLTLRAGGFPMVSLMFAWGGPEGHHNIFDMNSSLLGGSARPLLD
jgi:hypothetical protein